MALAFITAVLAFGAQHPPEIAIDRKLAHRFDIRVGDTIALTPAAETPPTTHRVAAIYEPRPDPATALRNEYRIRFHLPDLTRILGHPDRVDRFAVAARPGVPAESLVTALNRFGSGFRAHTAEALAGESSRTFVVVSRFHRAIAVIAIVASAVFLLCIMLLKVEERRLDAAVMRLMGISASTIRRAFVLEALFVAVIGSILGLGLAAVAGVVTNWAYQRRFDTGLVFSHLTPDIVAFGVGLSIILGVAAGTAAATRLVGAKPLALWRRSS
jgi:putative ABC transport system permease protein